MPRCYEHLLGDTKFHHAAQIHHRDPLRHQPHHREVMTDEQVRQPEPLPQIQKQPQHDGLHRNIQAGGGLIQHDKARLHHQNARQPDPALLPAADLMRIQREVTLGQTDSRQHFSHPGVPVSP